VLAFAEGREEPTMVVLDLSRDASIRAYLTEPTSLAWTELSPMAERFAALSICYQSLASGTNYSRGDQTVLAILFTSCAAEGVSRNPLLEDETNPDDPQD
jgi:hypothetical protein